MVFRLGHQRYESNKIGLPSPILNIFNYIWPATETNAPQITFKIRAVSHTFSEIISTVPDHTAAFQSLLFLRRVQRRHRWNSR